MARQRQYEFSDFLRPLRADILAFCRAMRFDPTHQQRDLFLTIQRDMQLPRSRAKRRFAVRSGQGPGKTAASVIIALWLLIQEKDTLGVLSAPTLRQCKDVWITEAERLIERADPWLKRMFDVKSTRIICLGRKKWAITVATAVRAENLQGYHQDRLFFIVDEASGVKREIFETIKGTVGNEDACVLAIGNPNTQNCAFYDFFYKGSEAPLWHKFAWSAEDVPERVSPHNIRLLEMEFGRDSDPFRIRVLGEFPHMDPNCIIAMDDLNACVANNKLKCAANTSRLIVPRALSYDFARFGGDENIVMQRSGLAVIDWAHFPRGITDPSKAVKHGFVMQKQMGWLNNECWHIPDATGMGQGLMHLFHDAGKQVHEFNFNAKPSDAQYKDKITEAWFHLRTLTRERAIYIPNDPEMIRQLTARQYDMTAQGQFLVESKEDYLHRGGGEMSPDRADAIVLLFYDRMMSRSRSTGPATTGRALAAKLHGRR